MLESERKGPGMSTQREDDLFTSALRAKLHSSQVDSGRSLTDLAEALGLSSGDLLRDYFSGKKDMPVSVLHRYGRLVGRPIWWFFGEQPATISVEAAETALGNISRVRVYLDAIESEFRSVLGPPPDSAQTSRSRGLSGERLGRPEGPVVVDFAPYLSRARAILEREAEYSEDSEEVFEESVEMIAHSLYSIEMAQNPSREFLP